MDLHMDNEEALRDNRNEDANVEAPIPSRLRSLGATFQIRDVRAILRSLESLDRGPRGDATEEFPSGQCEVVIILYLLYPDTRQQIVDELRAWILSGNCQVEYMLNMFPALGELNIAEEIEQEHAEALLEFVDVLGSLMVEARGRLRFPHHERTAALPLDDPFCAMVAAKLLQYVQSVEPIRRLTLSCENQHRAFRPDEVEQFVNAILHLEQLEDLKIQIDMMGVLLVELCARLNVLEKLSQLRIHGNNRVAAPQELPNNLIRNIQRISSLERLRLYFAILGESTVDLFSFSEGSYTKLELEYCRFMIGDDDVCNDPSVSPLAVALASNTRLEYLYLRTIQGSGAFFAGIEQGLLRNRTLRTLHFINCASNAGMIPEPVYFAWMQSIRLHPSLRRLVLDMDTWSGRVAESVCSVVRENTSLHAMELSLMGGLEERNHEFGEWVGAVLHALQTNRAITYVQILAHSAFGHRNWNRLADLLNVNDSIESIYISASNDSIPERVIELLRKIKSNKTLQSLGATYADFR